MKILGRMLIGCSILLLVLCLFTYALGERNMDETQLSNLLKTLVKFREDNGISESLMQQMLGKLLLDSYAMRKGGIGVIDKQTDIILDEKRNALIFNKEEWTGKSNRTDEIVVVNNHGVVGSVELKDPSDITIVFFTQNEARFINLSKNSGAKYKRLHNN
jgi:hypothetical protein